jgi:hypothetical protein
MANKKEAAGSQRCRRQTEAAAPDEAGGINPFNLEELVVQPAYKIGANMVTSAATLPVQEKPGPQTFFMTHPDPQYAQVFWGVKWHESEDPSRGEIYIMHPSVQAAMQDEKTFRRFKIYYCTSQTGREFLVAAAMPEAGDKTLWLPSKHEGLEAARSRFLKMFSNQPAAMAVYLCKTDGPETRIGRRNVYLDLDAWLQDAAAGSLYRDVGPSLSGR